jgi:HipA-like protein
MRKAKVLVSGVPAGTLEELEQGSGYVFRYETAYAGPRVSLTLPVDQREVHFDRFPRARCSWGFFGRGR